MIIVWFPTAFYIVFKIIFKKKSMDWGKTEHGLAKENISDNIEEEKKELTQERN